MYGKSSNTVKVKHYCFQKAKCSTRWVGWFQGYFIQEYILSILRLLFRSILQLLLNQKEIRTTWNLSLVCFTYFLFGMPLVLHSFLVFIDHFNHDFARVAVYLYLCQYSLNFIIYCVRIENYRKAYVFYLRKVRNLYFEDVENSYFLSLSWNNLCWDIQIQLQSEQNFWLKMTWGENFLTNLEVQ